jgi:hypothetical protein
VGLLRSRGPPHCFGFHPKAAHVKRAVARTLVALPPFEVTLVEPPSDPEFTPLPLQAETGLVDANGHNRSEVRWVMPSVRGYRLPESLNPRADRNRMQVFGWHTALPGAAANSADFHCDATRMQIYGCDGYRSVPRKARPATAGHWIPGLNPGAVSAFV